MIHNAKALLKKAILKWTTLKKLYSGVIGKSIFIVNVISVLSGFNVPQVNQLLAEKYTITTYGALLILFSFMIFHIKFPTLLSKHDDHDSYFNCLLDLNDKDYLCFEVNFSILEGNVDFVNNLPIFDDGENSLFTFESINQYVSLYKSKKQALFPLSILKYSFIDYLHTNTRIYLSYSFYFGSACIFSIYIINISKFLMG